MALLALLALVASQLASSGDPRPARSRQGRRTTPKRAQRPAGGDRDSPNHANGADGEGPASGSGPRRDGSTRRTGRPPGNDEHDAKAGPPDEKTTTSDEAGNEQRGKPRDRLDDERLASGAGKEPTTIDGDERRDQNTKTSLNRRAGRIDRRARHGLGSPQNRTKQRRSSGRHANARGLVTSHR